MLLFLDDNADLCRAVSRLLKYRKIEGRCFQRWSDAKTALEEAPEAYKHALIDFGLSDSESGLDVIRWIRSRYPHIHCILTSGARRLPHLEETLPQQMFLPKPFDVDEFVCIVS